MITSILYSMHAGSVERLAAKELRRYWYELKNQLLPMGNSVQENCRHLVVATADQPLLREIGVETAYPEHRDGYIIKRFSRQGTACILLLAKTETGLLYAVYHFSEILGARFYLHGDVLPDESDPFDPFEFAFDISAEPCFSTRGILPFHDFPEGPDWWNLNDYRGVIMQLVKMRANFIGLHTYPESTDGDASFTAEPTVWIGKHSEYDENGNVFASYPAQHFKTNGKSWGYGECRTNEYPLEIGKVFGKSVFAADYMNGYELADYRRDVEDENLPPHKYNDVFNRYGHLLGNAFGLAKRLGVHTCVGTETPLTVPRSLQKRNGETVSAADYYKGIFSRITHTHNLDYYWLWTPEPWTWQGNTDEEAERTAADIHAALNAQQAVDAPFELALCGWALGPQKDRKAFDNRFPCSMPFSCINRNVGFDPVEPDFGKLSPDRAKWAIPWLEDDPALTSLQLFAGRMRRDAFDAKRYGCNGILGIHWRTKAVAPALKALMNAAWSQQGWSEKLQENITLEGWMGKGSAAVVTGCDESVYATARISCSQYRIRIPYGIYRVTLCFVDTESQKAGERVMDVLAGRKIVPRLDLYKEAGNRPYECVIPGVAVEQDVELSIELHAVEGQTTLSGIIMQSMPADTNGEMFCRKINCGGPAAYGFEADLPAYSGSSRNAETKDLYLDWTEHEFGKEIAENAAEILAAQDGRLPRPTHWEGGPGKIYQNQRDWLDLKKTYDFALKFAALEERVHGEGNRARFRYWKGQMLLLLYSARLGCECDEFEEAYERKDDMKLHMTYDNLYHTIVRLRQCLFDTLDTKGDLGVITDLQQRSVMPVLTRCQAKLRERNIDWRDVACMHSISLSARIAVLSANTFVETGEAYWIEFVVIGGCVFPPEIHWKPLGGDSAQIVGAKRVSEWAYTAAIPAEEITDDFEFTIRAVTAHKTLYYPENEQHRGKTVVVFDSRKAM